MAKFYLFAIVVMPSICHSQTLIGQNQIRSSPTAEQLRRQDNIKDLVVKLTCRSSDGNLEWFSAGLVFDLESDSTALAVTARHSLEASNSCSIKAEFKWTGSSAFDVRQLDLASFNADLAMLSITINKDIASHLEEVGDDALGTGVILSPGSHVHAIGFPRGKNWAINMVAGIIEDIDGSTIAFQGSGAATGSSGGPLLDGQRRIVGLVLLGDTFFSEAISIEKLVDVLRSNGRAPRILFRRKTSRVPDFRDEGVVQSTPRSVPEGAIAEPTIQCDGDTLSPSQKSKNQLFILFYLDQVREATDRLPRQEMINALKADGNRVVSRCQISYPGPPPTYLSFMSQCAFGDGVSYINPAYEEVAEAIARDMKKWANLPVHRCFLSDQKNKTLVEFGGIDIVVSLLSK